MEPHQPATYTPLGVHLSQKEGQGKTTGGNEVKVSPWSGGQGKLKTMAIIGYMAHSSEANRARTMAYGNCKMDYEYKVGGGLLCHRCANKFKPFWMDKPGTPLTEWEIDA